MRSKSSDGGQPEGTAAGTDGDLQRLGSLLHELEDGIESLAGNRPEVPSEPSSPEHGRADRGMQGRLAVLRAALTSSERGFTPQLSPVSPDGHSYQEIERLLGVGPGGARPVLEELFDLGLLRRDLFNRVHTCPRCHRCQINFRETCPGCDSIDVRIERLLHHFHCAYIGLESEFADGVDRRCPKCRKKLYQLGQDFERPHETYACNRCHETSELPMVTGQCLHCTSVFGARDARVINVYAYRPTPLTPRAVELGRLTALEVGDLLFDPEARLARLDYLVLEARREFVRMRRRPGALSVVLLRFEAGGAPFALFHSAAAEEIKDLGCHLTESLRELDLVAPVGGAMLSILLPDTGADAVAEVIRRLDESLQSLQIRTEEGAPVRTRWDHHSWTDVPEDLDAALNLVRGAR